MKKIIYVAISILILSCSSDEKVSNTNNTPLIVEPIIGKWKLQKEVFINSSNNITYTINASSCETISYSEFKANNTINFVSYELNSNNNCDLITKTLEYGNWQKTNNNNYKFILKFQGESEEISNENIEFTDSNNTMIYKSTGTYFANGQSFNTQHEYRVRI